MFIPSHFPFSLLSKMFLLKLIYLYPVYLYRCSFIYYERQSASALKIFVLRAEVSSSFPAHRRLIKYIRHNHRSEYVQNRMLFQKHRCKNDQRRQYVRRIADSFVFFQFFTLMDSDTHAQRIKYMQTRKYIRTCIRTIQHPHHIHK